MWGMREGQGKRAYILVGFVFRLPKHPSFKYVVVTAIYTKKRQGTLTRLAENIYAVLIDINTKCKVT